MKLVSSAVLPVVQGDLPKTLAGFVSLLRDHCAFDAQTRCTLHLTAKGWKLSALVARALPPEAGEFQAYLSGGRKMTAAEWLAQTAAGAKPDDSSCSATLTDSLSRDQTLAVLSELASALPICGRGVHLMLFVDSTILCDASEPVRCRLWLGRLPRGKARYSSSVSCEFEADSKSGPVAKKTLQELREALGGEWKKPVVMLDLEAAGRPSASEMTVIEQSIQEAFARATADLDRSQAALTGVPLLYSEMGAFYKRMRDVESGVREKVDFIPEFRQFMRANFPDYSSCGMGRGTPAFRKRLAEHLDGLLFVESYRDGIGKRFSLQYEVDFPRTRFAGKAIDDHYPSRSVFWLFHKGLMSPEWTYSTSEELAQALGGCRDVLRMALPVLEARLTELLSPPPETLSQGIETRGKLSAREAYEQTLGIAKRWAPDSTFIGLHSSGGWQMAAHQPSRGVDLDGRLQAHGGWLVRFESQRLNSDLFVEVPHSGQIRWNSMLKLHPLLFPLPSQEWLDSPAAMQKGTETIKELVPEQEWATWECGLGEELTVSAAVWKIRASFRLPLRGHGPRDAYVYLDPVDGSVVHSAVYEI